MRHRNTVAKLNRTAAHRRALLKNLATSLIEHERVITTIAKAKALRPYAERLITLGKKNTLHSRRQAMRWIHGRPTAKKLFEELAPRYRSRPGGYTRIVKIGVRPGDAAPMAMVQFLGANEKSRREAVAKKKRKESAKAGQPASAAASGASAA